MLIKSVVTEIMFFVYNLEHERYFDQAILMPHMWLKKDWKNVCVRKHAIAFEANERIMLFTPSKNKIRWKRINWWKEKKQNKKGKGEFFSLHYRSIEVLTEYIKVTIIKSKEKII